MNIRGKNLTNKDKFSSGDPYFVFKCGKQTLKTQIKSGYNPVTILKKKNYTFWNLHIFSTLDFVYLFYIF